jgi:hypothetical protein
VKVTRVAPQAQENPARAVRNAENKQQALIEFNRGHKGDVASGGVQYYDEGRSRENQLWKPSDGGEPPLRWDKPFGDEKLWELEKKTSDLADRKRSANAKAEARRLTAPRAKASPNVSPGGLHEPPKTQAPRGDDEKAIADARRAATAEQAAKRAASRGNASVLKSVAPKIGKVAGHLGLAGSIIALLSGSDPLEAAGFDVERAGETGNSKAAWIRRNPKLLAGAKDAERRYAVAQAKRQAANDHYWRGK